MIFCEACGRQPPRCYCANPKWKNTMTLHRYLRNRQIMSDSCNNTTEVYDDFSEMIADAKQAGWEIMPSSDGYSHKCPECVGGGRLARQRALLGQ